MVAGGQPARGTRTIHLIADPLGRIEETDEADNAVAKTLQIKLPPPGNLQDTPGDGQVQLQWDAIPEQDYPNILGYNVYREDVTLPLNGLDPQSGTTYTDTGLTNGESYAYSVAAVDTDGTIGKKATLISVPQTLTEGVDLAVYASQIIIDKETPSEGETIAITARVRNIGRDPAGAPFYVEFFHHSVDTGNLIGTAELVSGLASGAQRTVTRFWQVDGTGQVPIIVYADRAGVFQYEELNRDNNVAQKEITILEKPDLEALDLQIEPVGGAVEAESIRLTGTARNNQGDPGRFYVNFYIGHPEQGGHALRQPILLSHLESGATQPVVLEEVRLDPGTYNFYFKVDTAGEVAEENENNNIASLATSYEVHGKPDLVADSVTFDQDVGPNGEVTVTWAVKNIGGSASQPTQINFYQNDPEVPGTFLLSAQLPAIEPYEDPGDVESGEFQWTRPDDGEYDIVCSVVPDPREKETQNNVIHKPVKHSCLIDGQEQADLIVHWYDIKYSPSHPKPLDEISASVDIFNQGKVAGGAGATVKIYRDACPWEILPELMQEIPIGGAVASGGKVTVTTDPFQVTQDICTIVAEIVPNSTQCTPFVFAGRPIMVEREPDLATSSSQMQLSYWQPRDGEIVTVACGYSLAGPIAPNDVTAEFFLGDPDLGGVLLPGPVNIRVARAESLDITFYEASAVWDTSGKEGSQDLFFVLDRGAQIEEINELNNIASRRITVDPNVPVYEISGHIQSSPPLVEYVENESHPITLSVWLQNTGTIGLSGETVILTIFRQDTQAMVYQESLGLGNMPRGGILTEHVFGPEFNPPANGRYRAVLTAQNPELSVIVPELTIPVGPFVLGEMTVTPANIPIPSGEVEAKVHVESQNSIPNENEDLINAIKAAVHDGIKWEQKHIDLSHRDTCLCCHIQPQFSVSFELSRPVPGVELDEEVVDENFTTLLSTQTQDGKFVGRNYFRDYTTTTINGLWGVAFRGNLEDSRDSLIRGCDYLLPFQRDWGGWENDWDPGSDWFPALTADMMVALARAYSLDPKPAYWNALVDRQGGGVSALDWALTESIYGNCGYP